MVTASIKESAAGITKAFKEKDVTQVVVSGGMAVIGLGTSLVIGNWVAAQLGQDPGQSRLGIFIIELAALGVGWTAVTFLGDTIGGGLALGAAVAAGLAALGFLVGPPGTSSGNAVRAVNGVVAGQPAQMTASGGCSGGCGGGCTACGNSHKDEYEDKYERPARNPAQTGSFR